MSVAVEADAACHYVSGCRQRAVELDVAVGHNTTAASHRKAALASDQTGNCDVPSEVSVR